MKYSSRVHKKKYLLKNQCFDGFSTFSNKTAKSQADLLQNFGLGIIIIIQKFLWFDIFG